MPDNKEADILLIKNVEAVEYSYHRLNQLDEIINTKVIAAFEQAVKNANNISEDDDWDGFFSYDKDKGFDGDKFYIYKSNWLYRNNCLAWFEMRYFGTPEHQFYISYYKNINDLNIGIALYFEPENFPTKQKSKAYRANELLKIRCGGITGDIIKVSDEDDTIYIPFNLEEEILGKIISTNGKCRELTEYVSELFNDKLIKVAKLVDEVIQDINNNI